MSTISSEGQQINKTSLIEDGSEGRLIISVPTIKQYHQFQLTPLEQLMDKVGGQGKYQFKIWIIFNLIWFFSSFVLVGQGFFFDDQYKCYGMDQDKQCKQFVCSLPSDQRAKAIKWHSNSIVFAFKSQYYICELDYIPTILISLLYIGSFIGFFFIPYISDNWGRKMGIRISWFCYIFGIFLLCLADSVNMIGIGQFFAGFGCNPAITLCYSFLNQQVLRQKRQRYSVILQLFLAFGQCLIAFLFIPKDSWRIILWWVLGASIIILILLNYVQQSPKYLSSKSKQQTLQVLNKIAKKNGNKPLLIDDMNKIEITNKQQNINLIDLFKYKSLRKITICAGFVFLGIQVIYYSTLLNLDHIGYGKIINQQIIGLSQAAGYIAVQFVISKMHRKKYTILSTIIIAILCFILGFLAMIKQWVKVQSSQTIKTIQTIQAIGLICNRFILCGFWALFFVYVAQLYPTKVRSMGYGWSSAMGTIGSSLSPYLIYETTKINISSWIVTGIFGIFAIICAFNLKQTLGTILYDDIEQLRKEQLKVV